MKKKIVLIFSYNAKYFVWDVCFMCSIQDDLEHGPILKFQIFKLNITVNTECLIKFFVPF